MRINGNEWICIRKNYGKDEPLNHLMEMKESAKKMQKNYTFSCILKIVLRKVGEGVQVVPWHAASLFCS